MAMRYIIRRPKPSDLIDIKKEVSNLDAQLDKAESGAKRSVTVKFSTHRYITYEFFSKKSGTDFIWTCPSIELVAENEEGIFELTEKFHVEKPSHLVIE